MASKSNVLFFHVDNLGFGDLSCYSGGPLRGVTTSRIDGFARDGFRMTNCCPESPCTPSRSALLTCRRAIRSGTKFYRPSFLYSAYLLLSHSSVTPARP